MPYLSCVSTANSKSTDYVGIFMCVFEHSFINYGKIERSLIEDSY